MTRIGITGSRGFIGGHLTKALKDNKEIELSNCDLPECDLLNADSLKNFVRNKDIVIHAAAINRGSDTEVIAGTIVATYNLISAIEKSQRQPKLVFLSSIQAETETTYGLSKRLAEIMLEDFSMQTQTRVTIFRLTNVFGEACRPFYNSVVATFCHQVVNGQELIIHPESRNKKLNLAYVKDIVKLIVKEASIKRKKLFYFKRVSTKNEITVGQLAELIRSFRDNPKQKARTKFYKDLYKTYLSYK